MSKCFNSVEELKDFIGHGYHLETYGEIFKAYEQGIIDEVTIHQIRENLNDG